MRRDLPGPTCPTRKTSPAMVQVKLVDPPCILRSVQKAVGDAYCSGVLVCMLLRTALS